MESTALFVDRRTRPQWRDRRGDNPRGGGRRASDPPPIADDNGHDDD